MRHLFAPTLFAWLTVCITSHGIDRRQATPDGCKRLATDAGFPSPDVWSSALPGIQSRKLAADEGLARPDYRFAARTADDVQKAVRFASEHNVRLTVITTGHDYQGRNDAPSGLSLDTSQLRGVKVLPSFTPTLQGAESPVVGQPVNIIPPGKIGAAVTFGVGVVGSELNLAINESQIHAVVGASRKLCSAVCSLPADNQHIAATVSVAGGWGQTAGHSFISNHYGLGVDQFLEFKVVTADGQLKVANNVSNPDLFWALRGGGGGNLGVVTEATVKAYPRVPVAAHVFSISSQTASLSGLLGLDTSSDGLFDAIAYMNSQLPTLLDSGAGGMFLPTTTGYLGASFLLAENATEEHVNSVWDPVLAKMASFDGMQQASTKTYTFSSFQDFYDTVWFMTGTTTGGSGTGQAKSSGLWALWDAITNVTLDDIGPIAAAHGGEHASMLAERFGSSAQDTLLMPPSKRYDSDGDYDGPLPGGKYAMDSRLFFREHLENLPSQPMSFKRQFGSFMIVEAVAGNKVHRPDEDVSVLPAWRQAYVQIDVPYYPPLLTGDILREYAPNTGAYSNEVRRGLQTTAGGTTALTLPGILQRDELDKIFVRLDLRPAFTNQD